MALVHLGHGRYLPAPRCILQANEVKEWSEQNEDTLVWLFPLFVNELQNMSSNIIMQCTVLCARTLLTCAGAGLELDCILIRFHSCIDCTGTGTGTQSVVARI